ncbi:hypothetical protein GCM10009535_50490 [Streptomyces thermocarboxydovorans]|uniref:Uncharacterized protein n=1 Tax=Streptomyces thermocarboxydovorans TaxID=59298 RepID=A0ABN1HRU3_9ACTN
MEVKRITKVRSGAASSAAGAVAAFKGAQGMVGWGVPVRFVGLAVMPTTMPPVA